MNPSSPEKIPLIKELLIGYCLGTANIIPGVSGGTFLLIFNIYERVFSIISRINRETVSSFISLAFRLLLRPGKKMLNDVTQFLRANDFIFLFKLIIGAIVAIISLSGLMKYLITHQFCVTYALFFGLILVSIAIPYNLLKEKSFKIILFTLIGAGLTVFLTLAVNPYDKVKMKSDMLKKKYESMLAQAAIESNSSSGPTAGTESGGFSGRYTPREYLYSALCGGVAISAMVLPGVSGSLVLILMGEYFEVISAISALRTLRPDAIAYLGCFTIGMVLGGLIFARLLNLVLKQYYDATMAFLTGLMAGSLYALWPFKKSITMAHQYVKQNNKIQMIENVRVYTNINQLPEMNLELGLSFIAFVLGCWIMYFFVRKENRS